MAEDGRQVSGESNRRQTQADVSGSQGDRLRYRSATPRRDARDAEQATSHARIKEASDGLFYDRINQFWSKIVVTLCILNVFDYYLTENDD